MKLSDVGYLTDDPGMEYAHGLDHAVTLSELVDYLKTWEGLADDALNVALAMTQKDFKEWRSGLKKERSRQFSGERFAEKYYAILMPEVMFMASMIAEKFKAPWGTAIIRLREVEAKP